MTVLPETLTLSPREDNVALPSDFFAGSLPDALARDDFTNLVVLLRHARAGCWAFAIYNDVATRELVVKALQRLVEPVPVYEWTYSPEAPFPLAYLDRIPAQRRAEPAVVFLFDFERAGDEVWKALDYQRELYTDHPHRLVFWVTPGGRGEAARKAPHFWAQRSGVFDFTVEQPHRAWQETPWVASRDIRIDSLDEVERQLRLYLGLLDELSADDGTPSNYLANLHYKIARLAYYVDRLPEARQHTEMALTLAKELDEQRLIADTLQALGDLELREANLAQARQRYQAALPIYQTIGDRLGEANVLQALGDLELREANLSQARQRYQAALPIYQTIGDRLGEANVLQALGDLERRENNLKQAWQHFASALQIYDAIGSQLGIAGTLIFMVRTAHKAGDYVRAVLLAEEAVKIYRQITDRFGVMLALNDQGNALWALELHEAALAAWWQARIIAHAIGDSTAQRLDSLFTNVAQQLGDEQWTQLAADLAANAETMRTAAIASLRSQPGATPETPPDK
jgi:tetratricopeptide (TPR) repeat protein